jgi:hypothetical protein
MEEVKRFVGIDVAKLASDVFIGSAGVAWSVANDEVGHPTVTQTARAG